MSIDSKMSAGTLLRRRSPSIYLTFYKLAAITESDHCARGRPALEAREAAVNVDVIA